MNTIRPHRTSDEAKEQVKQYYIDNKAEIIESQKQWNITNKDKMKQYRFENKDKIKQYDELNKERIAAQVSERIHCEDCNCYNGKGNMARHVKTQTHLNNLEKENIASKNDL